MTKTLRKNIRRCITGSFGRYIAIVLIILLGVTFFTGLKLTRPAMTAIFTDYIESSNLFDLRLLSTWGFDDDDVEAVAQVDGVEYAVGSYYADFIWRQNEDNLVYRAQALNDGINVPELIAGDLPQAGNEVLGDSNCFTEDMIGQTISLADCNDEDTLEDFAYTEYTIVGICRTPLYLDTARGTTSLGNGSITGFVLLLPEGFASEYYTEMYVTYAEDLELYSDEYDDAIDALSDDVEAAATQSVQRRVDDLFSDAEQEIADGEQELADKKAEAEEELDDAWTELEDARIQLEDARAELDDAKQTLADSLQELEDGEAELADAKQELDDAKAQLDEGAEAIQSGYTSWESALAAGWDAYNEGQDALDEAIAEGEATLAASKAQLEELEQSLADGESQLAEGTAQYESGLAQWQEGYDQYIASLSEYAENLAAYQEGLAQYEAALEQFESATGMTLDEALDAAAQLESTRQTLEATAAALEEAKAVLDDTKAQLDALEETLTALAPDSEAYTAALEQWQTGTAEYETSLAEYETNQAAYEEELAAYQTALEQFESAAGMTLSEALDTTEELESTRQTLEATAADLEATKSALDDTKAQLDAQEEALANLTPGSEEYAAALAQWQADTEQYNAALSEYEANQAAYEEELAAYQTALEQFESATGMTLDEALDTAAQLESTRQSLEATAADLDAAKATLDETKAQLDALEEKLTALAPGSEAYVAALAQWQAGTEQYEAALAEYEANQAVYEAGLAQYEAQAAAAAEMVQTAAQLDETRQTLEASSTALEQGKAQLDAAAAELDTQKAALDAAKATLDESAAQLATLRAALQEGWSQYNAGVAELNTQKITQQAKLDSAKASLEEFEAGIEAYYEGLDSYNEGVQALADGWAEYEDGLAEYEDGEAEYADGLAEYQDGLAEYEDAVAEFDSEIADAEQELADARQELDDLEDVELYVLTRSTNSGYVTFESDSQIVDRLASVFPVFFFLIAALVCSTTMTRMVDDDRTQIGTMRALGYSRGAILTKYLLYSGTAAMLGCLAGFFLGGYLFPFVIWKAYQMIYNIQGFRCVYHYSLLAISMAASLLCSVGTTWFSCRRTMESTPADLIRPEAPAAGKRILLERFTPLWRRLKFLHKVTLRNIFRFKKRMFMMILGIAGCTALVLTGFGINDSIADIANYQYDDIQKYDLTVTYDDPVTQDDLDWAAENCGDQIEIQAVARMWTGDLTGSEATKSVYFVASDDPTITEVFGLHMDGETVAYPGTGEILISQKLATLTGAEVGDTVTLSVSDTETGEATVVGIVENYVHNYAYMTGETYAAVFSQDYEPETLVLRLNEDADEYSVSAAFTGEDSVTTVSVVSTTRNAINNMMQSLNYVVLLVLACAGALAFVVLFNLGNINISERAREIATIKVLGFHARETGAYVFRENFILSLMGICCGLPLGVALHAFVMSQIQVDMVYFKTIVKPVSYLLTVGIVILFTVVTDLVLRRKIRGIDMAESLKSVE